MTDERPDEQEFWFTVSLVYPAVWLIRKGV
jgi:hypothetical protein